MEYSIKPKSLGERRIIHYPQKRIIGLYVISMSSLFEDLKEGLEEAIAYEKGYGEGRVKTYMILPVKEYSGKEIRDIRTKAGMTQSVFASYMGVSIKTVEAWEGGRTHPTGPVFRLLDILSKSEEMEYIVAK